MQEAFDQQVEQLLPDVPVWAIIEVRQDQSDEIVIFFVSTSHDLVHAGEAPDCFLSDDVLAVCKLLYYLWNMPSQSCIAETPSLIRWHLILHHLHISLALLWHAKYHVEDVQRIEHDLEVLICEQLQKEIYQLLGVAHHILWVSLNSILHIMQYLIDGLGPHSPIVLCVHHSLYLVRSNQFTLVGLSLFWSWLLGFWMDVARKANVAHRGEHLLLIWWQLRFVVHHLINFAGDSTFQDWVIMMVGTALLFLNWKSSKVSCCIDDFKLLLLILFMNDTIMLEWTFSFIGCRSINIVLYDSHFSIKCLFFWKDWGIIFDLELLIFIAIVLIELRDWPAIQEKR